MFSERTAAKVQTLIVILELLTGITQAKFLIRYN
jgi:hypothetical protein